MTKRTLWVALATALSIALYGSGAAAEHWAFVVMADSQGSQGDKTDGVSTKTLAQVVHDAVKNVKPELILFAGDLVQGAKTPAGLESQLMTFRRTMAPAYEAKIAVYAIRGSHDVGENVYRPWSNAVWNKVFSGDYAMPKNGPIDEKGVTYSFTHRNAFFVGIDCYKSAGTRELTINQTWLNQQLAANKQPHVFAFSHTQIKRVNQPGSLDSNEEMRNAFFQSLVDAGGRVYFCGHAHLSNYTLLTNSGGPKDPFLQVIVPPSGLKFYQWASKVYEGNAIPGWTPQIVHHDESGKPGYTVVEVDDLQVTVTTRLRQGSGFETVATYTYSVPPVGSDAESPTISHAASRWSSRGFSR